MKDSKSPLQRLLRLGLIPLFITVTVSGLTFFSGNTVIVDLFNNWFNTTIYNPDAASDVPALEPSLNPLNEVDLDIFVDPKITVSPEFSWEVNPEFSPSVVGSDIDIHLPALPNINNAPEINIDNSNSSSFPSAPLRDQSFYPDSQFSFAASIERPKLSRLSQTGGTTPPFDFSGILRLPSSTLPPDIQPTFFQVRSQSSLLVEKPTEMPVEQDTQGANPAVDPKEKAETTASVGASEKKAAETNPPTIHDGSRQPAISRRVLEERLLPPKPSLEFRESLPIPESSSSWTIFAVLGTIAIRRRVGSVKVVESLEPYRCLPRIVLTCARKRLPPSKRGTLKPLSVG